MTSEDTTEMEFNDQVVEVPNDFICPITLGVMVHPLMTRSGLSFERSAIVNWLRKGNSTCPLTRNPMNIGDLVHNRTLEQKIKYWRKEHGIEEQDEDDAAGSLEKFGVFVQISPSKPERTRHRQSLNASTPVASVLQMPMLFHRRSSESANRRIVIRNRGESRMQFLTRVLTEAERR